MTVDPSFTDYMCTIAVVLVCFVMPLTQIVMENYVLDLRSFMRTLVLANKTNMVAHTLHPI
jgi:hypothetical protein